MPGSDPQSDGRIVAVAQVSTPKVAIRLDGQPLEVPEGQSILAVVLGHRKVLRHHLMDDRPLAGFCLMGACQECWLWLENGMRVRACTTPVRSGMAIYTDAPAGFPRL